MPTYDFRCPNGHTFQKFFKTISAAPAELPCTKCTEVASRQLSGGAGLVFKGSGFYLTDYGKNAHRKSAPGGGSSSEGSSDSGKSESAAPKSETKSESQSDSGAAKSEPSKASDSSKSTAQSSKPKSE